MSLILLMLKGGAGGIKMLKTLISSIFENRDFFMKVIIGKLKFINITLNIIKLGSLFFDVI